MIETPCSFCCRPAQRPDGQPFVCEICVQMRAEGLICRVTIPRQAYTDWGNWWDWYRQTRPLWKPSHRILRASP